MPAVTLFIPGLFSHALASGHDESQKPAALELLLARAKMVAQAPRSYYRVIGDLLNAQFDEDQDVPVAAVSRLLDAQERSEGYCLRADPVHLYADRDSLVLFDLPPDSLNQRAALALAAELKDSIHARGWELDVPVADRWYIKYDAAANIHTTELAQVTGRDIQNYLPHGEAAPDWQRLLTEIQMLLHRSEVNALRQDDGELAVNSLWLWGAGQLPQTFAGSWSLIYSDDVFVKGLALLSNTPCLPLPDDMDALFSRDAVDRKVLVVINARSEMAASYQALEVACFAPLLKKIRDGTIEKLNILTEQKDFELNKPDLNKFWRRKKSMHKYFLA